MKLKQLYGKNLKELHNELFSLLKSQVDLRMQIKTGQVKQTHLLKQNRRNIARIKTLININKN